MGPVHENDTRTSVSAIKSTPTSPPRFEFESALLISELGRTISKAPRNDAANTIKMMKNSTLGNQCVESQLKISAVTDCPPIRYVAKIMIAMGMV